MSHLEEILEGIHESALTQQATFAVSLQALEDQLTAAFDRFVFLGSDLEAARRMLQDREMERDAAKRERDQLELKARWQLASLSPLT